MDEFMEAIHAEFPKLVIQHEDFATERAFQVSLPSHLPQTSLVIKIPPQYLSRYQDKYPMFNEYVICHSPRLNTPTDTY
jgi:malate dehydrogenase (oxaloacetate-decarboxylating)(NADP+)